MAQRSPPSSGCSASMSRRWRTWRCMRRSESMSTGTGTTRITGTSTGNRTKTGTATTAKVALPIETSQRRCLFPAFQRCSKRFFLRKFHRLRRMTSRRRTVGRVRAEHGRRRASRPEPRPISRVHSPKPRGSWSRWSVVSSCVSFEQSDSPSRRVSPCRDRCVRTRERTTTSP